MHNSFQQAYQQLDSALAEAKTVLLTAHVSPDADGVGSMLGVAHAISTYYPSVQRVDCWVTGKVPAGLAVLPGIEQVHNLDAKPLHESAKPHDMAIAFDSGDLGRLGKASTAFEQARVRVNVDHHLSNREFGTINIIDTSAAATGQVVANFLNAKGHAFTPAIAGALYGALLSDTGGFQYSNTNAAVFQLAAQLVAAGAVPERIYKKLMAESSRAQLALHARVLSNAQFECDEQVGWAVVTREVLASVGALDEDTEGLVEAIRNVHSVRVAAVLKETPEGLTKVSCRSDDAGINVAEVMAAFGGGGHAMAAGCTITAAPAQAAEMLIPKLKACVGQPTARASA